MKQLILLVLLGFSLLSITINAQPISATWALTTVGTPALTGSNFTASTLDPTTQPNSYMEGYVSNFVGTAPAGLTFGETGLSNWNADGTGCTAMSDFTGISTGRTQFIQFSITPNSGYQLTINNISLQAALSKVATHYWAAGFSTHGTIATFTPINSGGLSGNLVNTAANTFTTITATPTLVVNYGDTVIVRAVFWRKVGSTASSTSDILANVVISGINAAVVNPLISPSTLGPLNFAATTIGTPTASQSFNVGGTNLQGNIIVTPPSGFQIRTGVNAFSSSAVTLTQSGGTVTSTQIDVRFNPSLAGSYSGNIQCTSTNASTINVAVNGGGYYYSNSSGNLDVLSTWNTNTSGSGGSAPPNFTTPGQIFYIRNNSAPTLGANWTVSGANSQVIVGDGTNVCVFTVPSSFTYSAQATEIFNQGTFVLQNAASFATLGALTVDNGGTYQHDCNGGSQLTGTFSTGSTIKVTGITSSNLWLPSSCYDVVWNCPSQTSAGKFYNIDGTINGTLTMLSTGTGYCALNTGSNTRVVNIEGNLDIQGGSFRLLGASSGQGLTTLNVTGNVLVSVSGVLNLSSTSFATPTSPILNVKGNFVHTAGTVTKSSSTSDATIEFNGTSGQQFSTIGTSGRINFVINNSSTGVTLNSPVNMKGTLTLTNGLINSTATNLITLSSSSSVSGGSSTSYVNGPFAWIVKSQGPVLFPIGKLSPSNAYRPITLNVTLAADSNVYTAEQIEGAHSSLGLGGLHSVSSVRFVTIAQTGSAPVISANLQMNYGSDDGVSTNNSTLKIAHNSGSVSWLNVGGTGSAPTSGVITSAGPITSFGDFILAQGDPEATLTLTAFLEAMYVAGGTAMTMTPSVTVDIHNNTTYALVESQSGTLSTSGLGTFNFTTVANGTPYYIVVKYINTIETWSATPQSFTAGAFTFDFTTGVGQAYGSNLALHGSKYCIFSGDVNQDTYVTSDDYSGIDNDNFNYDYHIVNDVNGDGYVTSDDYTFVDNNNFNYVQAQVPGAVASAKHISKSLVQHKSTGK